MPKWLVWTLMMTLLGIASAAAVYAWTRSVGWALVGLFASGIVANSFASARAGATTRRRGSP